MALTKRQKQVLDFIANFVDENGYCPSFEEIARGLELASLATVHKHISVLETKNYLKRGFNQSRSLELTPRYVQEQRRPKAAVTEIPLLGRIAAGAPLEAVEQREVLHFADFAGHGDTYALEVRGNSMIDDHICDGDMILLERVAQARDGDIVVALVAGSEATLKRFYREAGRHGAPATGQRDHQTDIGSCEGCADSGAAAGRPEKVQISGELLGAEFLLGAEPVCFGGAALASAGFPIRIGQTSHGVLERFGGRRRLRRHFRFRLRSVGNFYSSGRATRLELADLRRAGAAAALGHHYLVLGNYAFLPYSYLLSDNRTVSLPF